VPNPGAKGYSSTYDTTSSSTQEGFLTESMVNQVLSKSQPNKHKIDYDLRMPKPSNM
jgi:hypothetical protein